MQNYTVTEKLLHDKDNRAYIAYGIQAADESGRVLAVIENAFKDRESAERIAKICNENDLSVLHLEDIVNDALAEACV